MRGVVSLLSVTTLMLVGHAWYAEDRIGKLEKSLAAEVTDREQAEERLLNHLAYHRVRLDADDLRAGYSVTGAEAEKAARDYLASQGR